MFLRRCKRKKNGKQHTYRALVESYRTARGSRQRVVAYLGELKSNEQSGWARLGRRLDKKSRPQPSLFDPPHYDDPKDDEPVEINLKGAICVVKIFWPYQKCIVGRKQYFYNHQTDKHRFGKHYRVTKTRFSRLQANSAQNPTPLTYKIPASPTIKQPARDYAAWPSASP